MAVRYLNEKSRITKFPLVKRYNFSKYVESGRYDGGTGVLLVPSGERMALKEVRFEDLRWLKYLREPFRDNGRVTLAALLESERQGRILKMASMRGGESIPSHEIKFLFPKRKGLLRKINSFFYYPIKNLSRVGLIKFGEGIELPRIKTNNWVLKGDNYDSARVYRMNPNKKDPLAEIAEDIDDDHDYDDF